MEYKKLVKEIEDYIKNNVVKKFENYDAFENHVNPVRNHALELAELYHADKEVVEIAALLHDVAHMRDHEHHDLVGAKMTQKILRGKLSKEKIELIAKCVRNHRGRYKRETIEEDIIFCADVMSHINHFLSLVYSGGADKEGLNKTKERLKKEIEWGWKKMSLPEAKRLVEKKYKAIMALLND